MQIYKLQSKILVKYLIIDRNDCQDLYLTTIDFIYLFWIKYVWDEYDSVFALMFYKRLQIFYGIKIEKKIVGFLFWVSPIMIS